MTSPHQARAIVLALMLSAAPVGAQTVGQYRAYQLGSDLPSVAALAGVPLSQATTSHQRPALLQELEWNRPYSGSGAAEAPDPVRQIAFSFYDGRLSRLVIDYDRDRTAGLSDADMVQAISAIYGAVVKSAPPADRTVSQIVEESGMRVAGWATADYSVVLYRSSYQSEFRMIVTSTRLDVLARAAEAQAIRLDEQEAPQRELAREKKDAADARTAEEKARTANKAAFRP